MAHITLNGQPYTLVAEDTLPKGKRALERAPRPSQPDDPTVLREAVWDVSGPIGRSRAYQGEPLGVDYVENLDHRNENLLTSTAQRNAVTVTSSLTAWNSPPLRDTLIPATALAVAQYGDNWVAVATAQISGSAPLFRIYQINARGELGQAFDGPSSATFGVVWSLAFSPDGNYLVVGTGASPYIHAFPLTFTGTTSVTVGAQVTNPATLPAGTVNGIAFSPNGNYLTAAHDTSPYITTWNWSAGFGTAWSTVGVTLPTGNGQVPAWTSDSANLVVAHTTTPFVTGWPRSGNGYGTKFADPGTLPSGDAKDVQFTPNNAYVAVAHTVTPYVTAYPFSGAGFGAKVANPASLPTNQGVSVSWSRAGTEIAVGTTNTPFLFVYAWSSGFGALANRPSDLPPGAVKAGRSILFPSTDNYLILRHTLSPYFSVYPKYPDFTCADEDTGYVYLHHGPYSSETHPSDLNTYFNHTDHSTTSVGVKIADAVNWRGHGTLACGANLAVQRRSANNPPTYAKVTATSPASDVFAKAFVIGNDRLWLVEATGFGTNNYAAWFPANEGTAFTTRGADFPMGDPSVNGTGLGLNSTLAIMGQETGASSFTESGKPIPLIQQLRQQRWVENGRKMAEAWGWTYIMTVRGLFAYRGTTVNPVGPERSNGFEGPIRGKCMYVEYIGDSLYASYYTESGNCYVLRGEFGPETGATGIPVWYVFRYIASNVARCIFATGTGTLTPELIVGEGPNWAWYGLGRGGREIADPAYRFDTGGGSWYGTTLMTRPGFTGYPRYFTFVTENCFPADTIVGFDSDVLAMSRRWYEGEMVEITTASGHKLAGTPNHPIATDRGWVALDLLNEGDNVISRTFQERANGIVPNKDNMPSTFGEVFDLANVSGVRIGRPGHPDDFHGDGRYGNVDVVAVNSHLQDGRKTSFPQPTFHLPFTAADVTQRSFPCQCILDKPTVACGFPAKCAMHGFGELAAILNRDRRPLLDHDLRTGTASERIRSSDGNIATAPAMTPLPHFCGHSVGGDANGTDAISGRDTELSEILGDCAMRNTSPLSKVPETFASQVAFDPVISVRKYDFRGHVFNASTQSNLYSANGIIAHNCVASTDTWQVALSVNEATSYTNIGGAVTTNGLQRVRPVSAGAPVSGLAFRSAKPRLTQVASSTTAPPQIRGKFTMVYDARADWVEDIDVQVQLGIGESADTTYTRLKALLESTEPITVVLPDTPNTTNYGFVRGVGPAKDIKDNAVEAVMVRVQIWDTA